MYAMRGLFLQHYDTHTLSSRDGAFIAHTGQLRSPPVVEIKIQKTISNPKLVGKNEILVVV